jgi:hypothetical protein
MSRYLPEGSSLTGPPKPFSFSKGLRELSKFFEGKGPVHKSARQVAKRLEKAKIPYALVGGMAVFAHGHRRATNDVDLLLTPEGFAAFRQLFVPKNYDALPGRPRRFADRTNAVTLDILVTGRFPGSGKPGPIAYPDPAAVTQTIDNYQVVDLVTLIQLKLAARRYQDFADVVSLIKVHELDDAIAERLHVSVRRDYIECLEEKRREDEYEAING